MRTDFARILGGVLLVGALAAFTGPRFHAGHHCFDRRLIALAHCQELYRRTMRWTLENGRFPASLADVAEPQADPWDRPYELVRVDERNFLVRSLGRDGLAGTCDDIVWGTDGGGVPAEFACRIRRLFARSKRRRAVDRGDLDSADESIPFGSFWNWDSNRANAIPPRATFAAMNSEAEV